MRKIFLFLLILGFSSKNLVYADRVDDLKKELQDLKSYYEEKIKQLEEKIANLENTQKLTQETLKNEIETVKEKTLPSWLENIAFHGYGELHYNQTSEEGKNDELDFHRMVLGWSIPFSENIIFDAEVDFEHAASEMELEYAKLDFLFNDAINFRAGSMLMPVGYLNEYHEPVNFYSVERPAVQENVIPTTWQEGGAGIFGTLFDNFNYRLYLVGGLDASKFTASSGIRKGRQGVAEGKADDLAVVGRLEYKNPHLELGFSGYQGDSSQKGVSADVGVTLLEGDILLKWKNLEARGLISDIKIDDTATLNRATGKTIGEEILGWYAEAAYHLGRHFLPDDKDLVWFLRYEWFDTQFDLARGFFSDDTNERKVLTTGIAFYPLKNVVLKADIESWRDGSGKNWHQFNLGAGYEF